MRILFFLLTFFSICNVQGQKQVKKAFIGPKIESIQIDSQYCYQVNIVTANTNQVEVEASIEGEYAKDLLVTINEEGKTVLIAAGFHPNFSNPNDKLSAHKVVSIALEITVPKHKEVHVYGTNSNVNVEGEYRKLDVKLADGRCVLHNVVEVVDVTTQQGDILVTTSNGNITAKSAYGQIHEEDIPQGHNQFILNTVEGNIYLKKTK
ncbi:MULTISPECIES: hypothetical protein [Flavobacteriaceae]|uniref:hypothetical protein n=1 Tax=Flavobacteriaceae TaxID=49546 RepID=UPI001490EAA6|nr:MULTISPECIES: hypothetical protein [Allomuricauda]MDC6365331.1 hypothetical protein [Muricauda sp. AC10]